MVGAVSGPYQESKQVPTGRLVWVFEVFPDVKRLAKEDLIKL